MSRLLMAIETVKPTPAVASLACSWVCSRALGTSVLSDSTILAQQQADRTLPAGGPKGLQTDDTLSARDAESPLATRNSLSEKRSSAALHPEKPRAKTDVPQWRLEAHFRRLCDSDMGCTTEATQLVSKLIGLGLDVNTMLPTGETLLQLAAKRNAYSVVWQLLLLGADVHTTDSSNTHTAMHYAISNGNQGILQVLLDNGGAKWQRQDPSLASSMSGSHVAFADPITYLEKVYHCQRKVPLVHYAIHCNQPHLVPLLLHNGLDTEELYCSQTALQYLVTFHQNVEPVRHLHAAVSLLLQHGANVNAAHAGMSVIQTAILGGGVAEDTLLMMIEAGADLRPGINEVHCRDGTMKTLLLAAITAKYHRMAEKLLELGADTELVCQHNCTALHWSVMMCDIAAAQLLVKHGAHVHADARPRQPPVGSLPPPLAALPQHIAWSPMNIAAAVMQAPGMVEVLAEAGGEACPDVLQHVLDNLPHVRLALLRPDWSESSHSQYPDKFKANVKAFVLASKELKPQLSNDAISLIANKASYPLRTWYDKA